MASLYVAKRMTKSIAKKLKLTKFVQYVYTIWLWLEQLQLNVNILTMRMPGKMEKTGSKTCTYCRERIILYSFIYFF